MCLLTGITYFYKDKEYWKFNNELLRVEPGYPRSILKDFMGCEDPPPPGTGPDGKQPPTQDGDEEVVIPLPRQDDSLLLTAVLVPCTLALCVLALISTLCYFRRAGTPRHILYCKRSMQEWV